MDLTLQTDNGALVLEGNSDIAPTFSGLVMSALAVEGRIHRPYVVETEHEPGNSSIAVWSAHACRAWSERPDLICLQVWREPEQDETTFVMTSDVYSEAVWKLFSGLRDDLGIDEYYKTYREEFPSKLVASLEAARQIDRRPEPPHEGPVTILTSTRRSESKGTKVQ